MKINKYFIGFAILCLIVISAYSIYLSDSLEPDEEIRDEIENKDTVFDLGELVDVQWDNVYIIPPYSDVKQFCEDNDIEYRRLKTDIEHRDDINLLVFVDEQKIVKFAEISRSISDLAVPSGVINKKSAKFEYDQTNKIWVLREM